MQDEQALSIREDYGDDLAEASIIADHYASQDLLGDYQRASSANTRRRQRSELEVFCQYLAQAKVNRSAEALFTDLNAWRGISAGIVKRYLKWQLLNGSAMNTINIRPATIKRYCALATEAGALTRKQ